MLHPDVDEPRAHLLDIDSCFAVTRAPEARQQPGGKVLAVGAAAACRLDSALPRLFAGLLALIANARAVDVARPPLAELLEILQGQAVQKRAQLARRDGSRCETDEHQARLSDALDGPEKAALDDDRACSRVRELHLWEHARTRSDRALEARSDGLLGEAVARHGL